MRNLSSLDKTELWWLEDKFERYDRLDKEIAVRKVELSIKKNDTNIGGGKSNIPSSPVEIQVMKSMSDEYIKEREKWKKAISKVFRSCDEDSRKIIEMKYWSEESYLSWEEIGEKPGINKSKSQMYRLRYLILEAFAKEIGYI